MLCALTERFSVNAPELIAFSTVNPDSASFLNFDAMLPVAKSFAYLGIDVDRLRGQSAVAFNMFKNAIPGNQVANSKQVLSQLQVMPGAFPDLILFLKIVLTIPVSSANAERSFSTMKRVKTYLRSTMSEPRLNHLCMLAIEREMSEVLLKDPSAVVDKFAALKSRRLSFLQKH